jgi:pyrroline-5-carboxylate reductase
MKIGIIGCGHMGSAIAKALLSKKLGHVWASKRSEPHIDLPVNSKKFFHWTVDNREVVKAVDIIVIAVRPFTVQEVLMEIAPLLKKKQILISIAAGTHIRKLKKWSGGHKKIVRVMPNLPLQILQGMSVWKAAPGLSHKEKKLMSKLINTFGISLKIDNEKLIDYPISGVAPAYTAAFLESMVRVGRKIGYSEKEAYGIALQGTLGSLLFIKETKPHLGVLIKAVCTKGGVTEAGFKILNKKKWQATLEKALFAGYKRAQTINKR